MAESAPVESNVGFLDQKQRAKLSRVLTANYDIPGVELPPLTVRALDFTIALYNRLVANDIPLFEVRLNGSAASYVVSKEEQENSFNDLDIVFLLQDQGAEVNIHEMFENIRAVFFTCLFDLLPTELKSTNTAHEAFFLQGYIQKMFKVPNAYGHKQEGSDVWSLITLNSDTERNLEYKFVLKLRREFEFSIDSVQITLNLSEDEVEKKGEEADVEAEAAAPAHPDPFGSPIKFTTLAGPLEEVLGHVNNRQISISNPELVRGGGLLKYCYFRAQGYEPVLSGSDLGKSELYMCNRFLIDHPSPASINMTLFNYFLVRLRHKETVRHEALLFLHDLLRRSHLGDRMGFNAIVESFLRHLAHDQETETETESSHSSSLSMLTPRTARSDSPTSSIDSYGSFPPEGPSSSSSSSCSDTPARPWGDRLFASVVGTSPHTKPKPSSLSPAAQSRPPHPSALHSRGASAPSSPAAKPARGTRRQPRESASRSRERVTFFESDFPALSATPQRRGAGPRS